MELSHRPIRILPFATEPYQQRLEVAHKRDRPYFSVLFITKVAIGDSPTRRRMSTDKVVSPETVHFLNEVLARGATESDNRYAAPSLIFH